MKGYQTASLHTVSVFEQIASDVRYEGITGVMLIHLNHVLAWI